MRTPLSLAAHRSSEDAGSGQLVEGGGHSTPRDSSFPSPIHRPQFALNNYEGNKMNHTSATDGRGGHDPGQREPGLSEQRAQTRSTPPGEAAGLRPTPAHLRTRLHTSRGCARARTHPAARAWSGSRAHARMRGLCCLSCSRSPGTCAGGRRQAWHCRRVFRVIS